MKPTAYIKKMISMIKDPDRDFSERVFIVLTIVSDIAVTAALIGDIITGENIYEIVILTATIILVPIVAFTCLLRDRIRLAIRLIICGLVFLVLPCVFFFGGGVEGGATSWFIFAFLYVGLVLSGRWRNIMLSLIVLLAISCYVIEYYYPQYIPQHNREMFYIDSCLSVILVGFVCYAMVFYQNRLFKAETDRAHDEAKRFEELNRSQNRFFSSMSHEIRTPINSILGLNELILREQGLPEEISKEAAGIQGAGKMLLALINDILDFSKMEAGSMDIVPVDYNVGDMLSEIVSMIWQRANEKGLAFNVSVDPHVPRVLYGDEIRIRQILINLINNAIKYTRKGSVRLNVESGEDEEGYILLRISVVDTGAGIRKDSIPYLFDAFRRADERANRYIEGTGLGLSIVKQLVELMDGTVSVDSVYGEGSTFSVAVRQKVSDATPIGDYSIHSMAVSTNAGYTSRFTAFEARILIVDDNEMNLEVERKLLLPTHVKTDTSASGEDALKKTLNIRYDVILMDHLMPQMDGIECFHQIRTQDGGLNNTTPVIVLTANAGGDNKELYRRAGFDGYLVKPVSGAALEEILLRHISAEKLNYVARDEDLGEDINAAAGFRRKLPVIIATSSLCDLPDKLMSDERLPVLNIKINTGNGVFKDSEQIDGDEVLRYIAHGDKVTAQVPEIEEYIDFFADNLKMAHNVIYIAAASRLCTDYERACEAAKSFDNVDVINSGSISSAIGILTLIGIKLSQQDMAPEEIVKELEDVKIRIKCSFEADSAEYLTAGDYISRRIGTIVDALGIRTAMEIRDNRAHIRALLIGNRHSSFRRYIKKSIPIDVIPDPDVVFVTYAGMDESDLEIIKDEISKTAFFENVVFQKVSAAVTINCGPGSFGIMYLVMSNRTYNISSIIPRENDEDNIRGIEDTVQKAEYGASEVTEALDEKQKWLARGIDLDAALANAGSMENFEKILQIFYDSIDTGSADLDGFYEASDWNGYRIKIHSLKSSAKLIGAEKLSEMAADLEEAAKEQDDGYIREHHADAMEKYRVYRELLADECTKEQGRQVDASDRITADDEIISRIYGTISASADEMDSDSIEKALSELEGYALPESEAEKVRGIRELLDSYDYDAIMELIG